MHQAFADAVEELGGAWSATPKKIVTLLGIPGLTIQHVKSHLQKYRRHLQEGIPMSPAATQPAGKSDKSLDVGVVGHEVRVVENHFACHVVCALLRCSELRGNSRRCP